MTLNHSLSFSLFKYDIYAEESLQCLQLSGKYRLQPGMDLEQNRYIEDNYFFEVNTKYISSSAVKKIGIFHEC